MQCIPDVWQLTSDWRQVWEKLFSLMVGVHFFEKKNEKKNFSENRVTRRQRDTVYVYRTPLVGCTDKTNTTHQRGGVVMFRTVVRTELLDTTINNCASSRWTTSQIRVGTGEPLHRLEPVPETGNRPVTCLTRVWDLTLLVYADLSY